MSNKLGIVLGCGLMLASATGCSDTIEPGDYNVYRIASAQSTRSASCMLGANETSDSSSLHAAGTLILFAGLEGEYYLDMGSNTLAGEQREDASYEFSGRTTDVEWENADGTGTQVTTTAKHALELTVDGELVDGEYKVTNEVTCTGTLCMGVPYSCTATTTFVGTQVEDLDLNHTVN